MPKFFTKKRIIIMAVIIILGLLLGRLAVRLIINFMVGGSAFGGNFL